MFGVWGSGKLSWFAAEFLMYEIKWRFANFDYYFCTVHSYFHLSSLKRQVF